MLLIVAIAANKLWPLEFLHVAGGAAWTIIDLFLGLVLGPIIGKMSIPARIEFTTRLMPKMVVIMPTVVTLTLAAGWQLATDAGHNLTFHPDHGWVVASMIVVGVMAVYRARPARAGEHRRAHRAQEAPTQSPGDREADEALHLLRRRPRAHAGRDVGDHDQAGERMTERKLPPVTQVGMASLALIVAGGIYLSAHLPQHVPLAPAVILLVLSALLVVWNVFSLTRVPDFPWSRFFEVAKWSLLAYSVITALILYAFLEDHVSGGPLVVLVGSLRHLRGQRPDPDRVHGRALLRAGGRVRGHRARADPPCGRRRRSTSSANSRTTTTAEWFRVNRARYESDLMAPARALAEKLSKLGEPHFFRPYRDTRFRPGPPIKEQLGVGIGYAGAGGYYFELSLDGLFVGAGMHHPATDQLERFRAAIDDDRRARRFENFLSEGPDSRAPARRARAQARAEGLFTRPPPHRAPATQEHHGPPSPRPGAVAAHPRMRRTGRR